MTGASTAILLDGTDARVRNARHALSEFGQHMFQSEPGHVLFVAGSLTLDCDLDADWMEHQLAVRGVARDACMLVVDGDLRVSGSVEAMDAFDLIVTGAVHCRALVTGETTRAAVAGDVHAAHCVVMVYNDTCTSLDGITHTPLVVIADHLTNVSGGPDTVIVDLVNDLTDALRRELDPKTLVDDDIDWNGMLDWADQGHSVFRRDVLAVRGALQALCDGRPTEAVEHIEALSAADFVEFHGPEQGLTPLHYLAIADGCGVVSHEVDLPSLVRRLLDAGAVLDATVRCRGQSDKPTPLHHAVLMGAERTARALHAAGADLYRWGADGQTIDELLLGQLRSLHDAETVDLDRLSRALAATVGCLRALEYDNIGEIERVVDAHLQALREGGADPTSSQSYRPRGWNEAAYWDEVKGRWLVQHRDIPAAAHYDPAEREWIVEGPGPEGYARQRQYYRPSDGTLCCVAHIPDPTRPNHFDMVRYHNDGSVSMRATWHDGHWHGEKVDYPYRGEGRSSEVFVLYTVPPNLAKVVTQYDTGRPTEIRYVDEGGAEIDRYGRPHQG